MKNAAMAFPALGLILGFGFSVPAGATVAKSLILQSNQTVQQQNTCKEDEVWDETLKKCVKKKM